MNERVKTLWIEALRSGGYKQCRSRLKIFGDDGPCHCCLGVLEEIAKNEGAIDGYDPAGLVLDKTVQAWAGLTEADPRIKHGSRLTALNDGGHDFNSIAYQIEQYL